MRLAVLGLVVAACGGGAAAGSADTVSTNRTNDTTLAPDTSYPAPQRHALVTRTVTPEALAGVWKPVAGVCREPPSFQLLARGDSVDVILVLALPAEGGPTGEYPVRALRDTAGGERPARIGVQRLRYLDLAYEGVGGVVRLDRLDRVADGRFDVRLREITSQEEIRYLGIFDGVRVDSLAGGACRPSLSQPTPKAR